MSKSNFKVPKILALLIAIVFLIHGCEEDRPSRLSSDQRAIQDSIITESLKQASERVDSICETRFERLVGHYYDSILDVRLDEIRKLQQRR